MTSSYYPVTTDNYFDRSQSKSMPSTSNYSSYQSTNNNYSDDDDDDDLDALRKAALKTLNSKKRKKYDQSPIHRHSRSSSSSSQSSYTHSSISRSYSSSSSLSSISSDSLHKNDKDYRFEIKEKASTADIDERFPNDNSDMLIVNCPIQDEDLFVQHEQKKPPSTDRDERKPRESNSKEVKRRKKSPSIEQPVSITVKLNSDQFDLRQLIKKRRTEESSSSNNRVVQILPKDNQIVVHKTVHDRLSSRRSEKTHKH